jgi:hypothetical protein
MSQIGLVSASPQNIAVKQNGGMPSAMVGKIATLVTNISPGTRTAKTAEGAEAGHELTRFQKFKQKVRAIRASSMATVKAHPRIAVGVGCIVALAVYGIARHLIEIQTAAAKTHETKMKVIVAEIMANQAEIKAIEAEIKAIEAKIKASKARLMPAALIKEFMKNLISKQGLIYIGIHIGSNISIYQLFQAQFLMIVGALNQQASPSKNNLIMIAIGSVLGHLYQAQFLRLNEAFEGEAYHDQ